MATIVGDLKAVKVEEFKSKHPQADMIIAKALNMDLVVLAKSVRWHEVESDDYHFFDQHFEYFLCLPKHTNAVLHSLNGGDVEVSAPDGDKFYAASAENWNPNLWCMRENWDSRIVEEDPESEVKRWVGLHKDGATCGPIFNAIKPENINGWVFIEDAEK